MIAMLTEVDRFEGTIVVFRAEFEDGTKGLVGVDHRPARDLLAMMVRTSADLDSAWIEPVSAEVEPWQVLARR